MKGSCLCGGIRFEIEGGVHSPRYCHCTNCRKFSGTGYAAWGIVPTDGFAITSAATGVTRYDSGGGLRAFCSTCGSPLWFEPANLPQLRGVPLGVIDDEALAEPAMHVWTKSKAPWVDIADDLPKHETHP